MLSTTLFPLFPLLAPVNLTAPSDFRDVHSFSARNLMQGTSLPPSPLSSPRGCYICMADVDCNHRVPLSPCQCRDRHVHPKCLLKMISTRKSSTCPVCNTQFRDVALSLQPRIHVGATLYNVTPVGLGLIMILLAVSMWCCREGLWEGQCQGEGLRSIADVCAVVLLGLGSGSIAMWAWAWMTMVESNPVIVYTWSPVVRLETRISHRNAMVSV